MSYTVTILRRAQKELGRLPLEPYQEVRDSIRALAGDPVPPESARLPERDGWRLSAGKCRVVYRVDRLEGVVTVMHVGLRADV